jgi:hypothetical protein
VYFWYPLNIVTGGTTAKIMLAAKDNFLGKYIYKDTLARNLATVIYKVATTSSRAMSLLAICILGIYLFDLKSERFLCGVYEG